MEGLCDEGSIGEHPSYDAEWRNQMGKSMYNEMELGFMV